MAPAAAPPGPSRRVPLARAPGAGSSRQPAKMRRRLKITDLPLLLPGSESSSTPGNGATPEECPALADSPTTLTEALQRIHPIPADSWRNLIEQIGGCPIRGKCGLPLASAGPLLVRSPRAAVSKCM